MSCARSPGLSFVHLVVRPSHRNTVQTIPSMSSIYPPQTVWSTPTIPKHSSRKFIASRAERVVTHLLQNIGMMARDLQICRIFLLSVLALDTMITTRVQAWLMPPSGLTVDNKCGRRTTGCSSHLHLSSQESNSGDGPPSETIPIFASSSSSSSSSSATASGTSDPQQKKRKKNKYAKFSKVENPGDSQEAVDPLEALIKESEEKLRQLRKENEAKNAKPVIRPVTPDADKRLSYPNNKYIDPYDPATFGYVEIGTILGPHGVHGWSKVQGCTDFPERLTTPGMVLHFKPFRKRAPRKVLLANGKYTGPDSFLVQLQDVYDRREAEKLKGGTLYYATQQDHVKKEQDLLLSDLVGYQVLLLKGDDQTHEDEEHVVVGTVGAIVLAEEMCAIPGLGQDMLEIIVEPRKGEPIKPGTPKDLVLIPMVPEICKEVDLKEQRIWIDPPAGLLDLTYIREEKVRIKGLLPPAKD